MTFAADTNLSHRRTSKSPPTGKRGKSQPAASSLIDENHPRGYKVFKGRQPDKHILPGDWLLYDHKPPLVEYYDVFYFETRVRDMIEEYMGPVKKMFKADKEMFIQLRFDYDRILERLHELEHFAMI